MASDFDSVSYPENLTEIPISEGNYFIVVRKKNNHRWEVEKKIVNKHLGNPVCIRSISREFEIGSQLQHPGIIQFYSFQRLPEPRLTMEFIDGLNWSAYFLKFPEEKYRIHHYISQLISAMKYLHAKGIYHMDLKPENILISIRDQRLKLIDFGHAVEVNDTFIAGGTMHFKPEQQEINSFMDIYAFGKIMEITSTFFNEKIKRKLDQIARFCSKPDENNNTFSKIEIYVNHILTQKRPFVIYSFLLLIAMLIAFLFFNLRNEVKVMSENSIIKSENLPEIPFKEKKPTGITVIKERTKSKTKAKTQQPLNEPVRKGVLTSSDSLIIKNSTANFGTTFESRYRQNQYQKSTFELYDKLLEEYDIKWDNIRLKLSDRTIGKPAKDYYYYCIAVDMLPFQHLLLK
jgi:serine/threonine protein kinase